MSLRARVIALVVGVAALGILLSAWLVSRSAEDAMRSQQAASLESSAAIYQSLAEYGASNDSWEGVGPLVLELSRDHDTRVALTTTDGTTVADSDVLAGRDPSPLPPQSAPLDPLVPVVYLGVEDVLTTRAEGRLAEAAAWPGAAEQRRCLVERGFTPTGGSMDVGTREQGGQARRAVRQCYDRAQRSLTAEPVRLSLGSEASLSGPLGIAWERSLAITLGILVLAALIGWWLGRRLTTPLTELAGAASSLASGDLRERSRSTGPDEVGQVGRAFNAMADSLEESAAQRNRLISDVAHELANPLVTIGGTLEAIEDGIRAPDPVVVASLREEVDHVSNLVRDLADLALADAGGLVLEREDVDLAAVSESVARSLSASNPHIKVRVQGNATAHADPRRVRQILTNLVGNAVRHSPLDGQVRVVLRPGENAAVVVVADDGEGIAPDDRQHVFERFWRADTARSRGTGGTGLGLAICRELARAHGGDVSVESELGSGSEFTLRLPTGGPRGRPRPAPPVARTAPTPTPRPRPG